MVVDLAGQVRILLARRLEHDLYQVLVSRQRGNAVVLGILLIRTLDPLVSLCDARYTFPNEPFPINRPTV